MNHPPTSAAGIDAATDPAAASARVSAADVAGAAAASPWSSAAAERVHRLYAHSASTLVGNALGAFIVALLYLERAGSVRVAAWLAPFAALWLLRLALVLAFRRAPRADDAECTRWRQRWNAAALGSAALWGATAWVFYGQGGALQHTALVLIVASLCVGSIPSLATQGPVYLGYVALAMLPMIAGVALGGEPHGLALAGTMALIAAVSLLLGRDYRASFDHLMLLKSRTQRLIDQLRDERALADAARAEAESANLAKSKFLAAASHDLRQPLHALALFAGALRSRNRDPQIEQLVGRIGASVDALDALFGELLDLTRLDSGGVDVRPVDFALAPLLERVRLYFEPQAFDKGLALRLRGGQHRAHGDPVLVERVLRNLVANAIRYTADGGVLVAVRRRGDRLALQVWDSGVGIAAGDRERIFDEFVRLAAGARDAEPARCPGLGLGLAIVRRLAALMDAPVELRSTPGRGSMFALWLPVAAAPGIAGDAQDV